MNVALRTIALCAGYGGLEIGLGAACEYVGWEHRVAAYVEREAYAAANLAGRVEEGAMDPAPIWSDLTTFDAGRWRGAVDCITAGFPCQPHSHAGSRKGIEDERWIWPAIARIVRESGAWLVVLENVAGLLSSGGFGPVLADLAAMGFDADWGVLSAASVGANHRRERVFILAHRHGSLREWQRANSGRAVGRSDGRDDDRRSGTALGNSTSARREERGFCEQRQLSAQGGSGLHDRSELAGGELADTFGDDVGRFDRSGGVPRATGTIEGASSRQHGERLRPRSGDGQQDMADAAQCGRHEGISQQSRQQRLAAPDECECAMANPCGTHSEGGGAAR